jgi:hypothetical protein
MELGVAQRAGDRTAGDVAARAGLEIGQDPRRLRGEGEACGRRGGDSNAAAVQTSRESRTCRASSAEVTCGWKVTIAGAPPTVTAVA